ncbi:hypothetical protein NIES970_15200 [[Synechococcus] sp. NIES-970]|uniref:YaaW family protein n=1 Tax=Picosynechococcus sp. NKBG15041c TaxID=1407650 RepID=UPI000422715F|nr:YaaW family protein [Picosynechococcus sp. NKBG15041c]BAW96587.1 hypothetical protein NIES970_15200 [[Synechococcus] sp. NIES-970]
MDELRTALELATDEELHHLTQLLFSRKFNPLDYWYTPQPSAIRSQNRDRQIKSIEARFRFLAADGVTVLRRRTGGLTYRQVLFQVGEFLKIPCATHLETTEIEAEIFLSLTNRAWEKLPRAEQRVLLEKVRRSLAETMLPEALPPQLQHDPLKILVKGGSTLVISGVLKALLMRQIAQQFARYFITRQATQAGTTGLSSLVLAQMGRRGLTQTAVRYGLTRNLVGVVVPALWGWFLADLGWRAIATNYGRIIPMIVTLAQIRLTREPLPAL